MRERANGPRLDPEALDTRRILEVVNDIEDDLRARFDAGTLTTAYFEAGLARAVAAAVDEPDLVAAIRELRPE
jgi:hypothetical protein